MTQLAIRNGTIHRVEVSFACSLPHEAEAVGSIDVQTNGQEEQRWRTPKATSSGTN